MTSAAGAVWRHPVTDPRAGLIGLALVMVAGIAAGSTITTCLAMGGLAGFSLSGSP